MATLNLNNKEFANLVIIFLLDSITNPEQATSENLLNFLNKHGSTIKPALLKQYLNMDSEIRLKYRRISGVFSGADKSIQQIRISPELESEKPEKKEGKIKKIVKKVAKKLLTKEELTQEDIEILMEANNIKVINESIKDSMKSLSQAMKRDEGYVMSWFHNLSVTFQDVGLNKKQADEGAKRFMRLAFDVEIVYER